MRSVWSLIWLGLSSVALSSATPAQELEAKTDTRFVENRGQWSDDVRFTARGAGWRAAIEERGWRLALAGKRDEACVVRMRVQGAATSVPLGLEPEAVLQNHFRGERRGIGARSFARVRFREVVPGVDLLLRGAESRLEYDLEFAPGADVSRIVFEIEGAKLNAIAPDGSLSLETPLGPLSQSPPRAFVQGADRSATPCASTFVRLDDTHFGFAVRDRRVDERVLIDPALIWSTYIGGNAAQSVTAIVPLDASSAVIAGTTESADFPVTPGVFDPTHNGGRDVFVSALGDHGQLMWSTFLGGIQDDVPFAIAADANGVVTLTGSTRSVDFPTTLGAHDTVFAGPADGFVARLGKQGKGLWWSTFVGGSKHDELHALAVDAAGDVTVAGWTTSLDFPVTFGAYDTQLAPGTTSDGCIARFDAEGRVQLLGSYFGGSYVDSIEALALQPAGGVLIGGATQSSDLPSTIGGPLGGEDGFVAVFDAYVTQLALATRIGGSGADRIACVATDAQGNVFAAGRTDSADLPVSSGAFGPTSTGVDGFLAQLDAAGSTRACSYLGGAGTDEILALSRIKTGELFAVGWTDSPDFPTTPGAYDRALNSGSVSTAGDAFVVRAKANLTKLTYSTFFGGADDDRPLAVAAIDFDTVLLAGETASFFFPTTAGAHRTSRGVLAPTEGFASRLDLLRGPVPYGTAVPNSYGASAVLGWGGFPSVADHDFKFVVNSAPANQSVIVFLGTGAWNQPISSGNLFVRPPLKRVGFEYLDFIGYAELPFTLLPSAIGTTLYAQAWFTDPWASAGSGMTSALEVFVYP